MDETDHLIIDRDRPAAGRGRAVHDYRGAHALRVARGDGWRIRPARCDGSAPA
jgi:hypothetical protein